MYEFCEYRRRVKPYFYYERKWNYIDVCTGELYDVCEVCVLRHAVRVLMFEETVAPESCYPNEVIPLTIMKKKHIIKFSL